MLKRIKLLFGKYKADKIHIMPYRSYGTSFRLYVKGRVLDNFPIQYLNKQSLWQTIKNAIKQFDTYEVPHITVHLNVNNMVFTTVTDAKGYFLFDVTVAQDMKGYQMQRAGCTLTLMH